MGCIPQAGTHADCVQQGLSCGSTKMVSTTYNRCIQQIQGDECQILFPVDSTGQAMVSLPADCKGVIQTFEPGGQIRGSWFDRASQLSTASGE